MGTRNSAPFVDMRSVVTLARREGERLAGAIDFRRLEAGVRTRADAAVRDIEERGALVIGAVGRQLAAVSGAVLRRFSAATQTDVAALDRRVAVLEKRLGTLERRRKKSRRASV